MGNRKLFATARNTPQPLSSARTEVLRSHHRRIENLDEIQNDASRAKSKVTLTPIRFLAGVPGSSDIPARTRQDLAHDSLTGLTHAKAGENQS
jgi:hypothetical protein